MNKIEQMHLDAIQNNKSVRKQLCINDFGTSPLELTVASKSAEITEQIAIEFSEWQQRLLFSDNSDYLIDKTTKELFQEFLKTKQ